jgi:8-oxo-dGTP diphosphatase
VLYVVRHAKAGSRRRFDGDDRDRPLTESGRAQARALAERLAGADISRIRSSPYLRCVQTVLPLAEALGLEVETTEVWAEEADPRAAIEEMATAADGTLWCSHGDVIPEVITRLARRGMEVGGAPDWRKATVWLVRRDRAGADDGFVSAEVWPPPT